MAELSLQIEITRAHLQELLQYNHPLTPYVILISQRLDNLLNQYYKIKN